MVAAVATAKRRRILIVLGRWVNVLTLVQISDAGACLTSSETSARHRDLYNILGSGVPYLHIWGVQVPVPPVRSRVASVPEIDTAAVKVNLESYYAESNSTVGAIRRVPSGGASAYNTPPKQWSEMPTSPKSSSPRPASAVRSPTPGLQTPARDLSAWEAEGYVAFGDDEVLPQTNAERPFALFDKIRLDREILGGTRH
eukprot:1189073-Prorocentrum_minimum.AAC.1